MKRTGNALHRIIPHALLNNTDMVAERAFEAQTFHTLFSIRSISSPNVIRMINGGFGGRDM
jgi:hypothetical protein